jgi:glutathione S-transferase
VNAIASKVVSLFLKPNFETHYKFLEGQLASSPDGGEYLCGKDFSAADIMMWFPLEAGQTYSGMSKEQFPKLWAYVSRLSETQSYKRSVQKIEELEGGFQTKL